MHCGGDGRWWRPRVELGCGEVDAKTSRKKLRCGICCCLRMLRTSFIYIPSNG